MWCKDLLVNQLNTACHNISAKYLEIKFLTNFKLCHFRGYENYEKIIVNSLWMSHQPKVTTQMLYYKMFKFYLIHKYLDVEFQSCNKKKIETIGIKSTYFFLL